ncbi:hypothetical protein LAG90_14755 [Marinilongibacter aquaticus]|uniref:hypothetical protein n=1 Tax=Marinilongibacter aquaticus TaxID=2975157 RepID=UPI0021BD88FA|nr:hypothetical protein [Marinilongibacter aquaticus]UBM58065.1 hypothetical protein LAG90_14755 [Marinilongibacter aquaticus]
MKKYLFLIGVVLTTLSFGTTSQAQGPVPCVGQLNEFFHEEVTKAMPPNAKPKVLKRLGSNPQFGRIRKHSAASAYAHLKSVKRRSRRKGAELDRLMRALGYTGVDDPEFSAANIEPVIVPAGSSGWMGSGSTKYFKAEFGKDFEGFKIMVKDGPCFVYIMKTCGNIFYVDPPACDEEYPCPDCINASSFKGKVNPFCNCTPCPECQNTVDQTLSFNANGSITSGDIVKGEKEVNLVASYGGESVCMGSINVPLSVTYEYTATGNASASETVKVDNQEGNAKTSVSLDVPVDLKLAVEQNQMDFGDNGAINLNVTEKRFKVLKKFYTACPSDMSSTSMDALMASEVMAEEMEAAAEDGNGLAGMKTQTITFAGKGEVSEVSSKAHTPNVTVIAHSTKTGKLINGESAERYLCLGTYPVSGKSELLYRLLGSSMVQQAVEVCDADGDEPAAKTVNAPIDMSADFTKQEMHVGQDDRVYIEITEKQYKKLAKRFSRCCSNGDTSCF